MSIAKCARVFVAHFFLPIPHLSPAFFPDYFLFLSVFICTFAYNETINVAYRG